MMSQSQNKEIEKISKFDDELVGIISDFTILSKLSWSKEAQKTFLSNHAKGKYKLPKVEYHKEDYSHKISALDKFIKKLGHDDHPVISFLSETADSYLSAYNILQNIGTEKVSEYSKKIYGGPKDLVPGHKRSNLSIAKYFLRVVNKYQTTIKDEPLIYSAKEFSQLLKRQIGKVIDKNNDPVEIRVDSMINARAAAGTNYVKVRKGAKFSEADLKQLLNHEVFTHTLTYINGRKQPHLKILGYGSPRITATQEGLAVFSEYITSSIELVRLKRIALRIIAIDMAEEGADLIDLFKFFNKNGQNEEESYLSAMRIFRGGYPEGGIVFYKDNIYLSGLIQIESFLKRTMHEGKLDEIDLLFSGKLTCSDVDNFRDLANNGLIAQPTYKPNWAKNLGELAAHLAFNDLTEKFRERKEKTS